MSVKERIYHSLLFEIIALALLVPFGNLISDIDLSHMIWRPRLRHLLSVLRHRLQLVLRHHQAPVCLSLIS